MERKMLKKAYYAGLVALGCYVLDQAIGNSSLSEMYNLLAHAPPNGNPIGATLSLFADNIHRLSLPGLAAVVSGAGATVGGLVGLVKKEKVKEHS